MENISLKNICWFLSRSILVLFVMVLMNSTLQADSHELKRSQYSMSLVAYVYLDGEFIDNGDILVFENTDTVGVASISDIMGENGHDLLFLVLYSDTQELKNYTFEFIISGGKKTVSNIEIDFKEGAIIGNVDRPAIISDKGVNFGPQNILFELKSDVVGIDRSLVGNFSADDNYSFKYSIDEQSLEFFELVGNQLFWKGGDIQFNDNQISYTIQITADDSFGGILLKSFSFDLQYEVKTEVDLIKDEVNYPTFLSSSSKLEFNRSGKLVKGKLMIFDPTGKVIFQDENYKNEWPVGDDFKLGFYCLVFQTGGTVIKGKVMKMP
ncbi:hypothetical protein [Aureibacter tunicatorum]|uniref:Uncharacterized protein n=1 Tax=Aureibacter tunicatorum TaxID=866807 RepID=A0AAE3XSV5_9BACT|nr:hypothetical protein [Aureibacter tunicatorum]MDR6241478.1 hypothetical protein [Aureibacter tunicatorum]BDD06679.1 hypothetical protein AUTU_41620 [Aureibacter tunicatorum]